MEEPKDKITLLNTIIKEIDREHLKWYPLYHLGPTSEKAVKREKNYCKILSMTSHQ
jgi:hypothetical protein